MSSVAMLQEAPHKRAAILAAAERVIARLGLHAAPVSLVAREAGVAAGTLYLYFPSKEAMINALYLDLLEDRRRVTAWDPAMAAEADPLWAYWHPLARWHLDRPEASNVLLQCEASGILTAETIAERARLENDGYHQFEAAIAAGAVRDLPRAVFWALLVGPVFLLVQLRTKGEIAVSAEELRLTYAGVRRAVLPAEAARG